MQLKRFFLLKSFILLAIVGVFGKIYQQNSLIKLHYEKQRLERHHQGLVKSRNAMLVCLAQVKDYAILKKKAEQSFGMSQLPLSRLITFTGSKA